MEIKAERVIAYSVAIILLVVGVVCYAAFPPPTPEQPIRIMLENTAGSVLFDHKVHTSENGYGIDCEDCHHNLEDEGEEATSCGECHDVEGEDALKRSEAFHTQCVGCHEDEDMGPINCSECHVM